MSLKELSVGISYVMFELDGAFEVVEEDLPVSIGQDLMIPAAPSKFRIGKKTLPECFSRRSGKDDPWIARELLLRFIGLYQGGTVDYVLVNVSITHRYCAVIPPSAARAWPVTNEAASEHNHTTTSAISEGCAMRPTGSADAIFAAQSSR